MPDNSTGFWSYVQQDDVDDFGRIISLSRHLRSAFRLLTSSELLLFVDRESLQWGDEWQARIADAIAGTTFFIPIITPSYFQSAACRRELLKFSREARRLGLERLLMPIYWITVSELEQQPDEIADEAIGTVAGFQWQDFRTVRLEEEESSAYRKAVHRLAEELAQRASEIVSTVEDVPPPPSSTGHSATPNDESDSDDEPGLLDLILVSEETWPELTNILNELTEMLRHVGEIAEDAGERAAAETARGASLRSRMLITERLAHDLSTPASRIEELGHRYASLLTETDPGVLAMLDLAADAESDTDRDEFLQVLQELWTSAEETLTTFSELIGTFTEVSRLSRSLRAPLNKMRRGVQGILDGRGIIEEWARRAREIDRADPVA